MTITNVQEATDRLLGAQGKLSKEEFRAMYPFIRSVSNDARMIFEAELSLVQLETLEKLQELAERQIKSFTDFDTATKSSNRWMLLFTAAVTAMTLVLVLIAAYQSLHENGQTPSPTVETKEASTDAAIESVKADPSTWKTADMVVTCPAVNVTNFFRGPQWTARRRRYHSSAQSEISPTNRLAGEIRQD